MARPRLPSSLKRLHGTLQPSRSNRTEPKPPSGIPAPPSHLSARASAVWPQAAATLLGMGVLSRADGIALGALCEAFADLMAARASIAKPVMLGEQVIAEAGALTYTTIGKSGQPMIRGRPEVAQIADADRRLALWLAKFGLSPADRSRVSREGFPVRPSPWDRFGGNPQKEEMDLDEFLASWPLNDYAAATRRRARRPKGGQA